MSAALAAAIALLATPVLAQSVHWEDPGTLAAGEPAYLKLVFADTEPAAMVPVPRVAGLTVLGSPSQESNVTVINGKTSATFTLRYPVRAEREGQIAIPSFEVKTSDGVEKVAALQVDVGAAGVARSGAGRGTHRQGEAPVSAEMNTSTHKPYAGEVFGVDLTVGLEAGRRGEVVGTPSWDAKNVVSEPWGDGKRVNVAGGAGVRIHTRALAPQPGSLVLPPAQQEMRVDVGRERANPFRNRGDMLADIDKFFDDSLVDSFFSRTQLQDVTVESNPTSVEVQPLPQPAPTGFTGAVGQFELESKLVPEEAKTGDPVTWTLTLRGTGNWPGGVSLPPRAIPADVRTLQPKQQRQFEERSLFSGSVSEDVVMIPSKPGDYSLAPVRFVYFNPATAKYETTVAEPPSLHVGGAAIAASTGAAAAATGSSNSRAGSSEQTSSSSGSPNNLHARVTTPDPPSNPADVRLPHEAQAGVGVALTPMPRHTWLLAVALPFTLLGSFWILLAVRRAWITDPKQRRREALQQLAAAIDIVRRATEAEQRRPALLAWQHAAAIILEIDFAAPTPAHLKRRSGIEGEWIALWSESDRALYGRDAHFDISWCERAVQLCRHVRKPRRNPLRAFLPSNLLPKMVAAGLLIALALPVHADDAMPAAADNQASADATTATAPPPPSADASAPSDWVARYNRGIDAFNTGDNGRALSETAAAFLLNPNNNDVRWNLAAFAERVPGIDPLLARFADADNSGLAFARLLSPAAWQLAVIVAAFLFCVGGCLALRRRYAESRVEGGTAALAMMAVGTVVGLFAWACVHQYAHLADTNAAMLAQSTVLHSIPTDAEEAKAQRPIAAGAAVIAHKNFLGWTQVELPSGEIGWVRKEGLVSFFGGQGSGAGGRKKADGGQRTADGGCSRERG